MTREEAIERLKQNKAAAGFYAGTAKNTNAIENELKDMEAMNMAIEALQQVTGKLKNRCNSLLTADSDECKEQKSKLDLVSIQMAIEHWGRSSGNLTNDQIAELQREIESLPSAEPKTGWIPVSEKLPKCEQEVLICTEKKLVGKDAYIDSIVTPAIYEDGTMLEVGSMWSWYDMDFDEWDDEEDCGIIPMGWFENRHFNPDEVYNNPVDRKVVAWMPLPEPYGGDTE